MAFEQKDMSAFIFTNNYKEKAVHPDFKGKIKIHGEELEIACWEKEGKNGRFLSCNIQEKRVEEQAPSQPMPSDLSEDDIPF